MQAEQAKAEAEGVLADYQAQLADARTEASRIIEEARQSADAVAGRSRAAGRRPRSPSCASVPRPTSRRPSSRPSPTCGPRWRQLAIGAAERVVERNLDRETQLQLVENYINQVGATR